MPKAVYAYKLGKVVPLLDASEWRKIEALLANRILWIKDYRQKTGCSIPEAVEHEPVGQAALDRYEELTGCRLDHPDQLWAVQMSRYCSLCPHCAKPFRTAKARICAECGYALPGGRIAGPLAAVVSRQPDAPRKGS